MNKTLKTLQQKLAEPIQLPPLAKNINVLMSSLADSSLNYQQVAEVIKHYPEITARIIFLANSPWSAPIAPITSIEEACSRLGIPIVKSISIAISIARAFDSWKCPCFNNTHFWLSSMLVAEAASLLAAKLPANIASKELTQLVQTAGILHNLGLLWLADNFPSETNQALKIAAEEPTRDSVSDLLKQYIGNDYCEISGWLSKKLKFPETLTASMLQHRNLDYQDSGWEASLLVGEATKIASALLRQEQQIASSIRLETIGVDSSSQTLIYQQLFSNFDKTQSLAKILFEK